MRSIIFRGKRIHNGEWVDGSPVFYGEKVIMIEPKLCIKEVPSFGWVQGEVIPETVGQFTGLCDKNGKKIFEGDIVRYSPNLSNMGKALDTLGTIVWHECGMFVISGHSYWDIGHIFNSECKDWADIIGNIHDNPELLEESKNE